MDLPKWRPDNFCPVLWRSAALELSPVRVSAQTRTTPPDALTTPPELARKLLAHTPVQRWHRRPFRCSGCLC